MSQSFKIAFSGIPQNDTGDVGISSSNIVPEFSAVPIMNYDKDPDDNNDMFVLGSTNLNSYFIDKRPKIFNSSYYNGLPNTQIYTDSSTDCSLDWDFSNIVLNNGTVRAGNLTKITGTTSGAIRAGQTIYFHKSGDNVDFQGGKGGTLGNEIDFVVGELIYIEFKYFIRSGNDAGKEEYLEEIITGYYRIESIQESTPAGNPLMFLACPDTNGIAFTNPVDIIGQYDLSLIRNSVSNPINLGGTSLHHSYKSSSGRQRDVVPKMAAVPRYRGGLTICHLEPSLINQDINNPQYLSSVLDTYSLGSAFSSSSDRIIDVVSYERAGVIFVASKKASGVDIHVIDSTTLAFKTIDTFQLKKDGTNDNILADVSVKLTISQAITSVDDNTLYPELPNQLDRLIVSYSSTNDVNGMRIYDLAKLETYVPPPTPTPTPTVTPTISVTPTVTPTIPTTPSNTPTLTATPTVTPTVTPSFNTKYQYTRKSIVLENLDCGEYELTIDYVSNQFGNAEVQILDSADIGLRQFDNKIKFLPQNIQNYRRSIDANQEVASDEKYNQRIYYTIYHETSINKAILKFTLKHLKSGKERIETRIIECDNADDCTIPRVDCVDQDIQQVIQLPDGSFEVYVALDPPPTVRKGENNFGPILDKYITENRCCSIESYIEGVLDWAAVPKDNISCVNFIGSPTPTPTTTPTITLTPSITSTPLATSTLTPTPTPTVTDSTIPCGEFLQSGGQGFYTYDIPLQINGGIVILDIHPFEVADKFEIVHNGVKKATSSMTANGNYGPFDNEDNPFSSQFIGLDAGSIPDRLTQFKSDTSLTSYTLTAGYSQVLWWKYTASDWSTAVYAQIRVGAPSGGTKWKINRRCDGDT